jgi:hypothetical protein
MYGTMNIKFKGYQLFYTSSCSYCGAGIAQSVSRLATGWTVRGLNPGGGSRPDRPWAHPASCTMGTGSFSGVKCPSRDADHPPLLVPRSGKSRAIPLTPSGPLGMLRVPLPLPLCSYYGLLPIQIWPGDRLAATWSWPITFIYNVNYECTYTSYVLLRHT